MVDERMGFRYVSVFCQDKFIPLWDAPSKPSTAPSGGSDRSITIDECPGCHRQHTFPPEELHLRESSWKLEIVLSANGGIELGSAGCARFSLSRIVDSDSRFRHESAQ